MMEGVGIGIGIGIGKTNDGRSLLRFSVTRPWVAWILPHPLPKNGNRGTVGKGKNINSHGGGTIRISNEAYAMVPKADIGHRNEYLMQNGAMYCCCRSFFGGDKKERLTKTTWSPPS